MDLTNIYNQIKNPIDDDYVIRKLLEAYSKSGVFYSNLVKTNIEESDGKYSRIKPQRSEHRCCA